MALARSRRFQVVHTSQDVVCVTNGHVSNVLEPSVIEHPLGHPDVLSSGWKEEQEKTVTLI